MVQLTADGKIVISVVITRTSTGPSRDAYESPELTALPGHCGFAVRCRPVAQGCRTAVPPPAPVFDGVVRCVRVGGSDVLAAASIVRRYGRRTSAVTALDGVSLTVAAGERVAVCGPSGSGKFTLAGPGVAGVA